jgi:hypothetical protein
LYVLIAIQQIISRSEHGEAAAQRIKINIAAFAATLRPLRETQNYKQ